jgi:hypothetical protein
MRPVLDDPDPFAARPEPNAEARQVVVELYQISFAGRQSERRDCVLREFHDVDLLIGKQKSRGKKPLGSVWDASLRYLVTYRALFDTWRRQKLWIDSNACAFVLIPALKTYLIADSTWPNPK